MTSRMTTPLSTYTAKANNIGNAYKRLKHVSVQTEHSPSWLWCETLLYSVIGWNLRIENAIIASTCKNVFF